jgi:uncharacterized protein YbjT (DUF2867 family)
MSRVLLGGSGWMGSRVLLQLLAVGDVQPIERVSFIADRDNDAGRLDAAAGCEFVDDRIRLGE